MGKWMVKEDFISVDKTNDSIFRVGQSGVLQILQSRDKRILLVMLDNDKVLMGIITRESYVVYYPLNEIKIKYPIKAVLMDLDGTTLYSEDFWIYVIEETMRNLMNDFNFHISNKDIPFISGHSVSEHLQYCIDTYCPALKLSDAINLYYETSQVQLNALINGKLEKMQIKPAAYLKDFLLYLIKKDIKVGLVTSGLYEKAYPEIWSVCSMLDLGKPEDIYDSIITAGTPLKAHHIGTLGELTAKPHPWLYLETALIGLNISINERSHILGIEDSGAGICALRAAGIPSIGLKHGNIKQSGLSSFCVDMCDNLQEVKEKYL